MHLLVFYLTILSFVKILVVSEEKDSIKTRGELIRTPEIPLTDLKTYQRANAKRLYIPQYLDLLNLYPGTPGKIINGGNQLPSSLSQSSLNANAINAIIGASLSSALSSSQSATNNLGGLAGGKLTSALSSSQTAASNLGMLGGFGNSVSSALASSQSSTNNIGGSNSLSAVASSQNGAMLGLGNSISQSLASSVSGIFGGMSIANSAAMSSSQSVSGNALSQSLSMATASNNNGISASQSSALSGATNMNTGLGVGTANSMAASSGMSNNTPFGGISFGNNQAQSSSINFLPGLIGFPGYFPLLYSMGLGRSSLPAIYAITNLSRAPPKSKVISVGVDIPPGKIEVIQTGKFNSGSVSKEKESRK